MSTKQINWKSESIVNKTVKISRRVLWVYFIILFLLAGLLYELTEILNLNWLRIFVLFMGAISLVLLAVSWGTPGILILIGKPWLARAWLRGINSIAVSATPWEQLSGWQKLLTYMWSFIFSGFTLLAISAVIIQALGK